jgi:predicted nucleic acid-binding protein
MVESKPLFILDSSVALKWFLEESESDREQAFLLRAAFAKRELSFLVPADFFVEFSNVAFIKKPGFAVSFLSRSC